MVLVLDPLVRLLKEASSPSLALSVVAGAAVMAFVVGRVASRDGKPTEATQHHGERPPLHKLHTLPNPRFLVGDLLEYVKNAERFHDWLAETSLVFGNEPWCLRIGGQKDLVVLSTPEAFEDVLVKQSDIFPRGEYANAIMEGLVGRSLLTTDGAEWHRQRKAAAKFFTARALRICMTTTMRKNVGQVCDVLDAHVASGAALDLSNLLGQFALQTFAEVGLGADLRWIGTDVAHPIEEVVTHGATTVVRRFRVPTFWWKLERALSVGPERRLKHVMATTRAWLQTLIDESLRALEKRRRDDTTAAATADAADAVDTVKSVVELFFEHSAEDQAGLRAEDLVDFILTFVLAAQDTSSLTLTRVFLMVAKHPRVAQRVRDEMAAVLPTLGASRATYLTTDHVHHLVYLEATIKEVLRLYPTAPLVQREARVDAVICGNVPIRKGASMGLQLYAMARNPRVWGADAAEFKPERWIDETTGALRAEPPTKFASFGAGPHLCIGMKLGMLELRVVTANLLHRYALALAAPNDGGYLVSTTLAMKNPLMVCVRRRDEENGARAEAPSLHPTVCAAFAPKSARSG